MDKLASDKVRIALTILAVLAIVLAVFAYVYRASNVAPERQVQEIR